MNSFAMGKLNLKHMHVKYLPESREEMGAEINWWEVQHVRPTIWHKKWKLQSFTLVFYSTNAQFTFPVSLIV